jgi:tetratricopeptide (TPR) repeat protein
MKQFFLSFYLVLASFTCFAQDDAQKAFSEGVKLLKAGKFQDAEKQFSTAIAKGGVPEGIKMSYIYKGFSLNGQLKYDEAIGCFDKAIEMDPADAASYTDRGLAFSYKADYSNAINDFLKVLSIDSADKQAEAAFYYLGRIKSLQGKYEEAILFLDKLLQLVPTDSEGYFLRGTAKSNMMDIKGSIADYDMAIKYNPNYMEAYTNRGYQKINALPVDAKVGKKNLCLEDPCADFKKAKAMGDSAVDDMLFLYCSGCK